MVERVARSLALDRRQALVGTLPDREQFIQRGFDFQEAELATARVRLSEKARTGKLLPDDYSGNTFTVSNLGAFGVDQFTAIINQPDSAILAVGQIKDRPVVIDGGIHVRPIMKMTLSSDHRVIDGAVAAQFMKTLKDILEDANF
ncbi:MAG TPA: 2-oxo acid dehydrogenase subunit E2, partial [Candidatus Hydrogenedentes bacterium]|nr:2-oxo acid dehydrogenase subunit E2 [Candidatus Hydrogenedentota bacterium]